MTDLNAQILQACDGTCKALPEDSINRLLQELPEWQLITEESINKISRSYHFSDFCSALSFCNRIAALAEEANHHPRLCLEWGKLHACWWTHSVKGLHINDFIMAARSDDAYTVSQDKQD